MKRTEIEDEFACQLRLAKISFDREVQAIEGRKFKWDFRIYKDFKTDLLIEIQGGIWVKGGHSTGIGITRDCEKLNLATLAGYSCMAFTKKHIQTGKGLKWVQEYLK
jgi:hypothetical protein